jgi:hypothetical protein
MCFGRRFVQFLSLVVAFRFFAQAGSDDLTKSCSSTIHAT